MAYDWTQLTEKEITNLYLYGTPTTPTDLISDVVIRPIYFHSNLFLCGTQTAGQEYSKDDFIDAGADNEWRLAA